MICENEITRVYDARRTINSYPAAHRAPLIIDCCRTTDGPAKPLRPVLHTGERVSHKAWSDCYGRYHHAVSGVVVGLEIHGQLWSPFVRVKVAIDGGGLYIGNQNGWQLQLAN